MLQRQIMDCYGEGHRVTHQSARVAAALEVLCTYLCTVINEAEHQKIRPGETRPMQEYQAALKEFKDATQVFRDATAERHDLPPADGYFQVEHAFERQRTAYSKLETARRRFSELLQSPSATSGPSVTFGLQGSENGSAQESDEAPA